MPLRVRLEVDLIKRKKIAWPRFENDSTIMAIGAYRPSAPRHWGSRSELVSWTAPTTVCRISTPTNLLSKVAEIHWSRGSIPVTW